MPIQKMIEVSLCIEEGGSLYMVETILLLIVTIVAGVTGAYTGWKAPTKTNNNVEKKESI